MSERIRRPQLERTEPLRATSGLLDELRGIATGAAGNSNGGNGSNADAVSRSIGQGYRIVEEYLEQSRRVASQIAPGLLPENVEQGLGGLTSRLVRTTSEMFELWFQMIDAAGTARQASQANREPMPTNAASQAAPTAQAAPVSCGVTVQVQSRQPARVTVDLRPGSAGKRLTAHALRSNDDALPRIDGVRVDATQDAEPVLVAVRIPDNQPAGVYNAMIIDDATSLPVGTVSVSLSPEAGDG